MGPGGSIFDIVDLFKLTGGMTLPSRVGRGIPIAQPPVVGYAERIGLFRESERRDSSSE
jgi:hypothetical protein